MGSASDQEARRKQARAILEDLDRKFPEPPSELDIPPAPRILPAGTELWRVYFQAGDPALLTALKNAASSFGFGLA